MGAHDQQNIDASLKVLPIFLAGRKSLLSSRLHPRDALWDAFRQDLVHAHILTILLPPAGASSIFVFLRMGGSRDNVIVKLLDTDEVAARLPTLLANFNAANARCYLDADRQKLLAVVESSFGTFQPFNKLVRQIMRQKLTESQKLNDLTAAIEQSVVRSQRDGSVRV